MLRRIIYRLITLLSKFAQLGNSPLSDWTRSGLTAVRRSVISAGFALPRDAGRRPAVQAVPAPFCHVAIRGAGVNTGGPLRSLCPQDQLAGGGAALEEAVGLGGIGQR